MSLEDTTIRSLQPPQKGQKLYRDDNVAGFGCRVSQGGTKTFVLIHGRDRRTITIGRYPIISLSQARTQAKRLLAEFTLGKTSPHSITYEQAVDRFLKGKSELRRPSTVYSYKLKLARLKFLGPLSEITHDEAERRLDRIKAPSERRHALVAGKVFFNWCIKRRYLTQNPLIGLSAPKSPRRKRVLSGRELKAIWNATEQPSRFNCIIRLCMLTAQRRSEIALLSPSYIQEDVCVLPAEVTKNHCEHAVPLTPWAARLLKEFPFSSANPFNDWGNAKAQLDLDCQVEGWVIHDIRRTIRSTLPKLGVQPYIAERLLNHVSSQTEMERTYDLYSYLDEKRDALERWEAYFIKLEHISAALNQGIPRKS
jgi:integrase